MTEVQTREAAAVTTAIGGSREDITSSKASRSIGVHLVMPAGVPGAGRRYPSSPSPFAAAAAAAPVAMS